MRPLILFLTLFSYATLMGQSQIDQYIDQALGSNIALQEKNLSYEKSMAALKEAKAMFLPTLSFEARYSVARGGRAFVFPIGDLMNPVYDNLNLVNSLGRSANPDYPVIPEYPQIENEEVNFLREREQETKLRVIWPVFNSAILQNNKIQQSLVEAEKMNVNIYQRELVKEVKVAYFNYAKAVQGVQLFENTLELVEENLRTTESLERNHKVTKDAVFSAKAEVKSIEQQLAEAQRNEKVAKAYFNFLLNRDYNEAIELETSYTDQLAAISIDEARKLALNKREEFNQLNYYLSASDNTIQLNKGNMLPQVNLVGDYGIQGTEYSFTSEDDFAMGSVILSWNILDFSNKSKVQQAKIAKMEVAKKKENAQQQIGLQVVSAFYDVEAATKSIDFAKAELDAAKSAFRLMQKRYAQGQANLVEFKNARTQLTSAEQKLIIARFDYEVKLAELERATASYNL
jgi:outer membrane protein TolC